MVLKSSIWLLAVSVLHDDLKTVDEERNED